MGKDAGGMDASQIKLESFIRDIPDWPKKGILFRDITPLLRDAKAFAGAIAALAAPFADKKIDYVAAVEARGFIFGSAVAEKIQAGFVPIRKHGKLPYTTESVTYDLEYGTDTLEVHMDAVTQDARVLMVDDLLATGGTMAAACQLVEKMGADVVGVTLLIELAALGGRAKLDGYSVSSIITY